MFFTIANPMEDEKCVEETSCDLTKPWIVPQKKTWKHHHNIIQPSGSKLPLEPESNTVDCRIPGVLFSAVEHQDTHRKDKVKPLIEKFESHQHKESFLQDFKQTKEINKFSKESQDLTADMNNTEIFELCETSSKQQCLD